MKSGQQYRRLIRIRVAPVPEDKKDAVLKDLIERYRRRFDKRSIIKAAADKDLIVVHWDDMQFGRKNPKLEKWQFVRSGRGGSFKREDLPLDPKGRLDIKKVLILLKLKKKKILGAREMIDQIGRDATLYQWGEVVAKEAWSAELGEYAYYVLRLHKDSWQKAHNEFWHLKRDISRMNVLPEKLLDKKSLPIQGIKLVILQAWFKGFGLEARLKRALDKVKQKNTAGLMLRDSGAKRFTAKQRRRARSLVLEQSALDSFKDGGIYYRGSGQAAVATPSVAGGEQLFTAAGAAYFADGGKPAAADYEAVLREQAARSSQGKSAPITYEQLALLMSQKGLSVSVSVMKKSKVLVAVFSAHPELSKVMKVTYRGIEFNQDAIIAALEQEKSLSKAFNTLKRVVPGEYKDVTYACFAVAFINLHPHLRAIWDRIKQENKRGRVGRQIKEKDPQPRPEPRPAAPKTLAIELTGSQMSMLEEIAEADPFLSQTGRQASAQKTVLNEDDILALQSLELIVLEADNFAYLTQLGANVLAGTVKVKIAAGNVDPVTEQASNGRPSREEILLAAERVKQDQPEIIVSDSQVASELRTAGFDVTVDWLVKQGGIRQILKGRWDLWTRPGSQEWNTRKVGEFRKRFTFHPGVTDGAQTPGRAGYELMLGALLKEGLYADYAMLESILQGKRISVNRDQIRKDPYLAAALRNNPELAYAIENPRIHKGLGSIEIKKAIRENPTRQDAVRILNAKAPDFDMKKMLALAEQYPDIGVLWDRKPELDLAHARSRGYMELEWRAVIEPEPVGYEAARQLDKDSRPKAGRQDYLDAAVDAFIKHKAWREIFIIAALDRKKIRGKISEIRAYSQRPDFMRDYRKSLDERLKNASSAKDGGEGDNIRALIQQKLIDLIEAGEKMPAAEIRAWLAQEHGIVRERWAIRRSLNALFVQNVAFRSAVDEEMRGTAESSRRIRKLLRGRLMAIVRDHEKEQDVRQLIQWLKTQGITRKHDAIREHLEHIFEKEPELRIAVDLKGVINEWRRARAHLLRTKSVTRTLEKIRYDLPRLSPLGFLLMTAVDPALDPDVTAMIKAHREKLTSVIAFNKLVQDRRFLRDFKELNSRKSVQNAIGWLLETGSYEESSGRIGRKTDSLRVFIEQYAYDRTEHIEPYIEAALMGLEGPENIPPDLTRRQKGKMRLSFKEQRDNLREEEKYAAIYIQESIDATVQSIAHREQQLLELIKSKHRQPAKRSYGRSWKSVFVMKSCRGLMEFIREAEGDAGMLWKETIKPLHTINEAEYFMFVEQTLIKHPKFREEMK
ncbi:MAG: hypothetical protein WC547_08790, partial [Candidatus Omnitrophota bacterium]